MIKKYTYGNPFQTDAVVTPIESAPGDPAIGAVSADEGFSMIYLMDPEEIVYGLGETVRGINKRGWIYISDCTDEPHHEEEKVSLYAAHNFIVLSGKKNVGLFFDYPGRLTFDIGYTRSDTLKVSCERADLDVYVIEADSAYAAVKEFRGIIGRSYIPPRFAFGFAQSRWGYAAQEDFREVADGYRENHIPIDMICMDIDYMQDYEDFTVNEKNFPDFPAFVQEMKDQNIRLIPIIDAAVKKASGYDVYEEGVENGYFCRQEDGSVFTPAVWPGYSHFPDFLNPEVRNWFGMHYQDLTDQGIEGFWNDMNEPAIFYTPRGLAEAKEKMKLFLEREREDSPYAVELQGSSLSQEEDVYAANTRKTNGQEAPSILALQHELDTLASNKKDYASFYHNVNGKPVRHDQVHNLFGCNMTRAAGEAFEKFSPDKRILIYSRSSYIGMHRYGGVWMGDNRAWWSHLLLNLKMLPSLNMCGFLYTGADIGGFGADCTRDLLLRWLALGVFTPLMRNHSEIGARMQECFRFENPEDFRSVISVRYRLLPYIYSEYMKAALGNDMMFKPLAFVWPEDSLAARVEDQLVLGDEIMIAPVYTQNADGRCVYLPEEMKFVKFLPDGTLSQETLSAGLHYVEIALNEVPLFIRSKKCVPLADAAEYSDAVNTENLTVIGYTGAEYELYEDDGFSRDYDNPENRRTVKMA